MGGTVGLKGRVTSAFNELNMDDLTDGEGQRTGESRPGLICPNSMNSGCSIILTKPAILPLKWVHYGKTHHVDSLQHSQLKICHFSPSRAGASMPMAAHRDNTERDGDV